MGQYHYTISMDANEHISPYALGCGVKAWEQLSGGMVASFAAMLSYNPGNMPADMGHHPMVGRWAGNRVLVAGDYADKGDIHGFKGTPLDRLYSLCSEAPNWDEYKDKAPRIYYKQGTTETSDRHWLKTEHGPITRRIETAKHRFDAANRYIRKVTVNGKYPLIADVSSSLRGLVEDALSVRFVGKDWCTAIPVKPMAQRADHDGKLHYELAPHVVNDRHFLAYIFRSLGLGELPDTKLFKMPLPQRYLMSRWPWDRAPMDMSHHAVRDKDADFGQSRVFANLDKREFVNPRVFGEQDTTAGIMRASGCIGEPRMAYDTLIGQNGKTANNVCTGDSDLGSASAVWAMLLHPEPRGGGDIHPDTFPEIGRWRNSRLVLTSEYEGAFPTTDEVKATFTDISDRVMQSTAQMAKAA